LIEQEVKLAFESPEAARMAVITAGGRLVVSRRLLVDTLFDSPDGRLRRERCALRLRRDSGTAFLTFKGPPQPGPVKSREEIETSVGAADVADALLRALGFQRGFLHEKYREEYEIGAAHVTIDETPIGTFVEIEAPPVEIERAASRLGRSPADYRLESYARLYADWCAARGLTPSEMRFP
jgi:adenylate cyclase class 2